jgi:hypothetical protein
MALGDSAIEADLGIDGMTESVIYAAGVGIRPHGVTWAPRSEIENDPVMEPNPYLQPLTDAQPL